jgi:hypothetical protein
MNATLIDRIETNSERAASALFGGAVGYALYAGVGASGVGQAVMYAAAAGVGAALLSGRILKLVGRAEAHFPIPVFDVREYDAFASDELLLTETVEDELLLTDKVCDELLLTDSDRLSPSSDVLELDQVLAEIGPDSRVVRLFDRKAMPTAGELKSRIDDHLGQGSAAAAPSDAAQALSDALAELKRSLR